MIKTDKARIKLKTVLPNLPTIQISKEFFPTWIKQKPGQYRCPLCRRPHYKEPGPFTYGITTNENNSQVFLWVKSFGCCKTIQEFPYQSINEQNINTENIVPILKKVFRIK